MMKYSSNKNCRKVTMDVGFYKSVAILFVTILLGMPAFAQPYSWRSLQMGGAGFVSGIITSRQEQGLIYARTDVGGAYKWNAATGTWTQLLDWVNGSQSGFYGVESLAIDPQAPNKLYMFVGINYFDNGKSAILRSENYGQTFTTIEVTSQFKAHGNGSGRSNGERLQVDPNLGSTLFLGTRANGLWKSVNSGTSWSQVTGLPITSTPNGNGVCFLLIDPASGTPGNASQVIYAGISRFASEGNNFYKSIDGGSTFIPVTGGPSEFMPQRAVLTSNGDLVLNYANGAGPTGNTSISPAEPMNNGGIYKYSPGSGTWTAITPVGVARAWGGLTVDPSNPLRMMASTINNYQLQYGPATGGAYGDRIYLTTNGGISWKDVVNPGFNINDNGAPWVNGQAIHWAGSLEFDPFNTSSVWVTSGNGVFSNSNIDQAAHPWKFEVKGLEETVPTAIVSVPNGPLYTTIADYDGFSFASPLEYGQRFTPTMGSTNGLAYAAANPAYLVRAGSRIYYTTDAGRSWTPTAVINGSQGKIALTANGAAMIHCPNGSSNIYYSTNNGSTWAVATNIAGGGPFSLSNAVPVADMVNADKVYLYNNGSGNFSVSTTGGASFGVVANIGAGGSKLLRVIPGKEGHIWVPLYGGGLRRSVNSGTTFNTVAGVSACSAIGYGKEAPGASYPALYIWGTVAGVTGIFRSTDEGANWIRLNTDATQFGGPGNAQAIMGDMNIFGTVYMTTVGRGVVMGFDPLVNATLPFNFIDVKASLISIQKAEIRWTGNDQSGNDYFEVERSINGNAFFSRGTVKAENSTANVHPLIAYSYADDVNGLSGIVYYRLKQVDKDGKSYYSRTVQLRIPSGTSSRVMIYPNPVRGENVMLKITAGLEKRVRITVMSVSGRVIADRYENISRTGDGLINLGKASDFSSGTYNVSVKSPNGNVIGLTSFVAL